MLLNLPKWDAWINEHVSLIWLQEYLDLGNPSKCGSLPWARPQSPPHTVSVHRALLKSEQPEAKLGRVTGKKVRQDPEACGVCRGPSLLSTPRGTHPACWPAAALPALPRLLSMSLHVLGHSPARTYFLHPRAPGLAEKWPPQSLRHAPVP